MYWDTTQRCVRTIYDGRLTACRYFKYGFYDLPTASYAEEKKEAFAIGEFLTITDGDFDASSFTGAALVRPLLR